MAKPRKQDEQLAQTVRVVREILKTNNQIPQVTIDAACDVIAGVRKATGLRDPETIERPLTIGEAAKAIGRSKRTVRLLAQAGKLKRVYGGNRRRTFGITAESVRSYLAEGRAK